MHPPVWLEPVAFGASRPSLVQRRELNPPFHRQASWRELPHPLSELGGSLVSCLGFFSLPRVRLGL